MVTTPLTTATGTLKRTVADQIRRLNPVMSPMLSLVKKGTVDKMGSVSYGTGEINKESTDTMKFEWFTETPIDIYATATADDGTGTAVTMADTSAFRTHDIVTNLTTLQVGIVATVTSPTVLVITPVTAAWSSNTGDVIAMSCRTMEEGTSDITPLTKEPDNNYNFVFPFRYVVSIADTAINSPHFAEQPLQRYMVGNTMLTMRNLENAFFLSERAATNNTTSVTIGGVVYPLYTTRGVMAYASDPIDGGGTMTFDRWCTTVFEGLPNTLNPDKLLKMYCPKKILGRMQNWAAQKLIYMESGDKDEFGVRPLKFFCGSYTIEPVAHNLFDQGALQNTTLIIDPADFVYRFKKGMDIQTVNDLQLPATWGTVRGIQGVVGLQCWSGGKNVKMINNWIN
jgi:hypothetical protein